MRVQGLQGVVIIAAALGCSNGSVATAPQSAAGEGGAASLAGVWAMSASAANHTALDLACQQSAQLSVTGSAALTGSASGTFACNAGGASPWAGALAGALAGNSVTFTVTGTPTGDCTFTGAATPSSDRATALSGTVRCVLNPEDRSRDLTGTWSAAR